MIHLSNTLRFLAVILGLSLFGLRCNFVSPEKPAGTDSLSQAGKPGFLPLESTNPVPEFSFYYLDVSESENRASLHQWLRESVREDSLSNRSFLVYFSRNEQPIVARSQEELPLVLREIQRDWPPIPKPEAEASQVLTYLQPSIPGSGEQILHFHFYLSPAFLQLSGSVFFDRVLAPFAEQAAQTSLYLYSDGPLARYARLDSLTYQSITYFNLQSI